MGRTLPYRVMRGLNENGILAFVTNNSFLNARTFDGFRKVVNHEFASICVLDLGGDVRKSPKLSGTKHNVFSIQTGVAISFLIKQSELKNQRGGFSMLVVRNWKPRWILDQYQEKKPKDSTIAEQFNIYQFADYKEKVIDLLQWVCTVSVKTMEMVQGLREG